jgi:thiol-disulfide isomerase/thioredoxin
MRARSTLCTLAVRCICAAAALLVLASDPAGAGPGSELIGTRPSELAVTDWLNSPPLTLSQLRGRVVLVRWWTGPECPYCRASAPYLARWNERYAARGLTVIGIYHHKSPEPLTNARVASLARAYGIRFPVAIDPGWRTLRRWWLDRDERRFTSVSFLLDREGRVRWIHPGGEYTREEARALEGRIRALLAQGAAAAS